MGDELLPLGRREDRPDQPLGRLGRRRRRLHRGELPVDPLVRDEAGREVEVGGPLRHRVGEEVDERRRRVPLDLGRRRRRRSTGGSASRAASPWSLPTRRRAFSRTLRSRSATFETLARTSATFGSFGPPSWARASRISSWSSGFPFDALKSSKSGPAARGSPMAPSAPTAGRTVSRSFRKPRTRCRTSSPRPCRPMFSRARARTHQSGSSRSFIQTGTARASSRRRESSLAGLESAGSGDSVELQERRDEARVPLDDRLEGPVADPDERPLERLEEAGRQDVGRDPRDERERSLADRLVAVGEEREDLPRVVALRRGKEPLERREGRRDDAAAAPRARQLEEVRRRAPRPGACSRMARAWTRVSSSSSFSAATARLRAWGERGDLLRLGDRPQGAGPEEPGRRRRGPSGRSRRPGRAGRSCAISRAVSFAKSSPRSASCARKPPRSAPAGEVLQEALDAPAGGLRARPRHRDDRVEDRPVDAPPLQDREARRPELRRRVGGGPGHVLDLEVRHRLELLDEVLLLGVARPLVGLQLRDDPRIGAEPLLHHLEDHGLTSVRGMLAQAKKEKGRRTAPFRNQRGKPELYFSSFHHLTLGTAMPPTAAEMLGGS